MTPENQQIRHNLITGAEKIYMEFIAYLNNLNLNKQLKDYAFQNLDQGLFWVRTAISSLALPQPEQATSAEPVESEPTILEGEVEPAIGEVA